MPIDKPAAKPRSMPSAPVPPEFVAAVRDVLRIPGAVSALLNEDADDD